jgi:hypothetical protein
MERITFPKSFVKGEPAKMRLQNRGDNPEYCIHPRSRISRMEKNGGRHKTSLTTPRFLLTLRTCLVLLPVSLVFNISPLVLRGVST